MFQGFSKEALSFLSDIRFNNNQTFYENNIKRYEEHVKAPLRALSDEMTPVVQLIDPRLDTRPGRTMSRIRRDTRHSKDKSPFRDHVWLGWRYPGESRSEGFGMWWGFGPDWLSWGMGCYGTDKPLMDALRLEIRRNPQAVRAALAPLQLGQKYEMYGEHYKKIAVPDDVPQDLYDLYTRKGFGVEHNASRSEWALLNSHAMADLLAAELAVMALLHQLMQRMRAQAEHAQAEQAKEKQEQQRAAAIEAQQTIAPEKRVVRSADEFEF